MQFWQMGKTRGHSKFEVWINGEHAIDAVKADAKAGEVVTMIPEFRQSADGSEEFSGYQRDAFGRIACEVVKGKIEIRLCNDDKGFSKAQSEACDPVVGFIVGTEESFTIYERPGAKLAIA